MYRAVKEYRLKYPNKAVMYSGDGYDQHGWAAFMAGGSMAAIPKVDVGLLDAASKMLPVKMPNNNAMILSNKDGYIVYTSGNSTQLDLSNASGVFTAVWVNTKDGKQMKSETIQGGKSIQLSNPQNAPAVVWLHK